MIDGDAERILKNVQGNLSRLNHRILMVQVEDLPDTMQRHVVGVPRPWVRLLKCLENTVVCYNDQCIGAMTLFCIGCVYFDG